MSRPAGGSSQAGHQGCVALAPGVPQAQDSRMVQRASWCGGLASTDAYKCRAVGRSVGRSVGGAVFRVVARAGCSNSCPQTSGAQASAVFMA